MSSDIVYDFSSEQFFSSFMTTYFIVMLGISLAVSLVFHFIEAKGLYTIAKRRGLPKPGLAYVPILKYFVVGKIAEQFESAQYGKTRAHTKRLLGIGIPYYILSIVFAIVMTGMYFNLIDNFTTMMYSDMYYIGTGAFGIAGFAGIYIFSLLLSGLSIPFTLFYHFAYYKVFRSLDPKTCVLFTVLGIVLGVTTPFVINKKREMDDGFIELKQKYESQL